MPGAAYFFASGFFAAGVDVGLGEAMSCVRQFEQEPSCSRITSHLQRWQ
jgi:hypothetical protein